MSNEKFQAIRQMNAKSIMVVVLVCVALVSIGSSAYFYKKYTTLKNNPNIEVQKETAEIVSNISKLMELPTDETPTVATISDKEKLTDQVFFKMAENGDILLAYTTAMKAILYRPATNKIINVAPIFINTPQNLTQGVEPGTPQTETVHVPKVAFFNGTDQVGLASITQKTVQAKYPTWNTSLLGNASKKDYTGISIILIQEHHRQDANELASLLNAKIISLPEGEKTPDVDILIISGK